FSALAAARRRQGHPQNALLGAAAALLIALTVPLPGSRSGTAMILGGFVIVLGALAVVLWRWPGRSRQQRLGLLCIIVVLLLVPLGFGVSLGWKAFERGWKRTQWSQLADPE